MIYPSMLRRVRLTKGLSQRELSRLSGVSQATISMIENGIIDPRFSIMERLSKALEREGKVVADVMTRKVISIRPEDSVKRARILMRKYGISQIPVVDGYVVGTVREADLMDGGKLVKDVMSPALPQLDESTPLSIAREILKVEDAVLVMRKGKVVGIVTKSDII